MSAPRTMAPLRRRGAIPGMTPPAPPVPSTPPTENAPEAGPSAAPAPAPESPVEATVGSGAAGVGIRRSSSDYGATRLVNFRLPVDLHDRFRRLVGEVEQAHPRLRRPSLTDVLIGLLEEGPETVDEVAAVIRRKRAAEYSDEVSR